MTGLLTVAAQAAEATQSFCFDCPDENSGFNFELWLALAGFSLVLAVPGFFAGMLMHRWLFEWPIYLRMTVVAGFVPAFWLLIAEPDGIMLLSGSLIASLASYFDGSRVSAERSSEHFTER